MAERTLDLGGLQALLERVAAIFGRQTAEALLPVEAAYAGMLAWDWRHARRVLTAWGEWAEDAPERIFLADRGPDGQWRHCSFQWWLKKGKRR